MGLAFSVNTRWVQMKNNMHRICWNKILFCLFKMGYSAGYGMALISYVQFYYVCEFGEDIENNGFTEMLYYTNWYSLPIKYQLDIAHLINRKQNGLKITSQFYLSLAILKFNSCKAFNFIHFFFNVDSWTLRYNWQGTFWYCKFIK